MKDFAKSSGFSILEMGVFLIIVGFLVGAVFAGQTLIRQSQINSITADEQRYKQAILTFQQKYAFLPGDFPKATTYWGTCANACSATNGVAWNDTNLLNCTCNGNGDGQICNLSSGSYNTVCSEGFTAWQHLNKAGMIDGSFIGGATHNVLETAGTNIPASKIQGAGFNVWFFGINPGSASYFNANYGHVMTFGMQTNSSASTWTGRAEYAALTAKEAQALDSKIDDGQPATGYLMTQSSGSALAGACTSGTTTSATYAISTSGLQCGLIFLMQDF